MNILLINQSSHIGGAESVFFTLANNFKHNVTVYAPQEICKLIKRKNVKIYSFGLGYIKRRFQKYLWLIYLTNKKREREIR